MEDNYIVKAVFKDGPIGYVTCASYKLDDYRNPSLLTMILEDAERAQRFLYFESCTEVAIAVNGQHEYMWRDGQCIMQK